MKRRPALLGFLTVLMLSGCAEQRSPDVAIRDADALLRGDDPAGAEKLLREALSEAPQDPRLRIALARVELVSGNPAAAEGSLQRALALGAPKDEVAVHLGQALLAKGEPERALQTIGDLEQWPAARRPMLGLIKAEAASALPNYDRRELVRSIAALFRLRERAAEHGGGADIELFDRRAAELRKRHADFQWGYEHFACRGEQAAAGEPEVSNQAARASADAGRRLLKVGPAHPLRRPSEAAQIAQDGDIIEIDGAAYGGDVAFWTQNRLLLRGVNGRPHLASMGRTARDQGIWVFRGNDIVVENIEFSGARATGRNGSGIRFFGRNLTIRDSYFHHNEDGVLTWHDPESDILVERSVFAHNGFGDGQSHNIYIGRVRSFTLRFSHSHDSVAGHEVKSRARHNFIMYNRLTDEEDGNSSYLIDTPEGGFAYVIGNVLEKGARSENPNAISFASERPDGAEGGLWVVNNTFYSRYLDVTLVANRAKNAPALVVNNVLAGAPAILRSGVGEDRSNFRGPDTGLVDPRAYDFSLAAESPLIDAGEDPGKAGGVALWPQYEYVHPAAGRRRQRIASLDAGAYEFCGW